MEKGKNSLAEIFSPRGVAVVGAYQPGRMGYPSGVVQSLKEAGFPAIYPVNPTCTEALGLPCYPNIRAIPGMVDHVVVSVRAESTLALLDDCAAKHVRSVQFFTAGFSESGYKEGAELEKAMLNKARVGGFRIIGPNCLGMYMPKSRFVTTAGLPLEPGPIAFLSQSGGYAVDLPFDGGPRGLRFSKVVSYGNALDVDESELLDYFSQDPETEIIAAYIEGVKDGSRFRRALGEAATKKPVVIFKGGRTEAGTRAAHGHTASMTSSIIAFDTLCRQMKTIQVDNLEELIDILVILRFVRPSPRGIGIAVMGAGGGSNVLASDEMEKAGLHLPHLSTEIQTELRKFLPMAGSIFVNPVDAINLTSPEIISATLRALGKVPDIHMLIYHLGFHPISRWREGRFSAKTFLQPAIHAMKEAQQATGKPILLALHPPPDLPGIKDFLATQEAFAGAGFPIFHSLGQLAKAIARVTAWKQSTNANG